MNTYTYKNHQYTVPLSESAFKWLVEYVWSAKDYEKHRGNVPPKEVIKEFSKYKHSEEYILYRFVLEKDIQGEFRHKNPVKSYSTNKDMVMEVLEGFDGGWCHVKIVSSSKVLVDLSMIPGWDDFMKEVIIFE